MAKQDARDTRSVFLVLPWHFIRETQEREKDFTRNGGTLAVPLPNFAAIDVQGFCANLPFSDVTGCLLSARLG